MSGLVLFAIILVAIFLIVTFAMFNVWHSYREENMLGGIAVMWIIIIAFFLVVLVAKNNRESKSPAETPSGEEIGIGNAP